MAADIFKPHPDDPQIPDSLWKQLTEAAEHTCQTDQMIVSRVSFRVAIVSAYTVGYRVGRYDRPRRGARRKRLV